MPTLTGLPCEVGQYDEVDRLVKPDIAKDMPKPRSKGPLLLLLLRRALSSADKELLKGQATETVTLAVVAGGGEEGRREMLLV